MLQQYQMIGEIFFRLCAKCLLKKTEYCCLVQMYGLVHTRCFRRFQSDAVIFQLFKVFSLRLQHIWRTYRANIRDQLIENTTLVSVDVILSVLDDVFRIQICDCYSMCLQFVCKQSDKNHSVHGCLFSALFSVYDDCILKSTTAWLLKLYVLYIHSFKHVQNISNKNSFQQCFIFNWNA